jgi:hypothetical protein
MSTTSAALVSKRGGENIEKCFSSRKVRFCLRNYNSKNRLIKFKKINIKRSYEDEESLVATSRRTGSDLNSKRLKLTSINNGSK